MYKANYLYIFKVKCMENLLPIVSVLNIRKPDIYKDNTCKKCFRELETNEHIIHCKKVQKILSRISEEV